MEARGLGATLFVAGVSLVLAGLVVQDEGIRILVIVIGVAFGLVGAALFIWGLARPRGLGGRLGDEVDFRRQRIAQLMDRLPALSMEPDFPTSDDKPAEQLSESRSRVANARAAFADARSYDHEAAAAAGPSLRGSHSRGACHGSPILGRA